MKTIFEVLCRLILLFCICAGGARILPASNQNLHLMVSGGGSLLRGDNTLDLPNSTYPAHFNEKLQLGILAAVDLHAPLALELGFRNEWGEYDLLGEDRLLNNEAIRFTLQQAFCNVSYRTPNSGGGLLLFVTAGGGFRGVHPENSNGYDFGWSVNFGGGLEARPSRRYSIRVELRDFIGSMPRLIQSQYARGLLHDLQPSIGLVIHLK